MKRKFKYLHSNETRFPTQQRASEVDKSPPYLTLNARIMDPGRVPVHNVLHWFRTKDLRVHDNRGFSSAMKLAKGAEMHCLAVFVLNTKELELHGVGAARNAFMRRQLCHLKQELSGLQVPLVVLKANSKAETVDRIVDFCGSNKVSHVFANYEYEYDELNRDLAVLDKLKANNIPLILRHDQCVVEPGLVTTAKGEPRRVFTSYWHGWLAMLERSPDLLEMEPVPEKQRSIEFNATSDDLDFCKDDGRESLWPAGHKGAVERLNNFLKHKVDNYGRYRSNLGKDATSRMSPYFAFGIISTREALGLAKQTQHGKKFGSTNSGIDSWVREIAFREFYRQMVAVCVPHIVMNMPTMLHLSELRTEEKGEAWERWCKGTTGVPLVDAGMRQLLAEGFMHNRARMNVASYLKMHLLLDYRLGMTYFANKLVDWDCCNNAFGWDMSYTIFNPVLQAEKNDPEGIYIKKWVPELANVRGKAVFDPFGRLSAQEFAKLSYPKPIIGNEEGKARAKERLDELKRKK